MNPRSIATISAVWAVGLTALAASAHAGRFMATPYAATVPEGKYSVWQFILHESRTTNDIRLLNRVDVGIAEDVELGIFVINPPNGDTDTWINVQYRVIEEGGDRPVLSLGLWDATETSSLAGDDSGGSFFISAGKTFRPDARDSFPQYIKVGLSAGTNRLNGIFGGFDVRLADDTGVMLEYVPSNLRMPNTESVDVGVYHWLSPHWRIRGSWMGGNPMFDVFYTDTIGK